MKKIAMRVTICLMIAVCEVNLPYIGNFGSENATLKVSASTHSVKKKKNIKNTKKNANIS